MKNSTKLLAPIPAPPVTTLLAEAGRDEVLQYAGAFPRDEVDERVIQQFDAGTGEWCKNQNITTLGHPLNGPAPTDTDHDGMPDDWEAANGFEPYIQDHNLDHDADGYTNLEEYINDLALMLIDQPAENNTGGVEAIYNPTYPHGDGPPPSYPPPPPPGNPITIAPADYGASEAQNMYELAGWTTAEIDTRSNYVTTINADGVKGGINPNYMYAVVTGPSYLFRYQDKIVATWYNNSGSSITFNPYVSFDDPDRKDSQTGGVWYPMGEVTIPAGQSAASEYFVTPATEGP